MKINADQMKALQAVANERALQDVKWGGQDHVDPVWNFILGEEFGEVCEALSESFNRKGFYDEGDVILLDDLERELAHVAAVAVSWIECIARRRRGEC